MAIALSIAVIFAVGLLIAAVAPTAGAARGIMARRSTPFYPPHVLLRAVFPLQLPGDLPELAQRRVTYLSARLVLSMRTTGVVAG